MDQKSIIFSGIQPTGIVHIGNYLGAIQNWVKLQSEGQCYFSVVNLHAITIPYQPETLRQLALQLTAILLACGVDENQSTLFLQSHIPQHSQLMWLLSSVSPYGDLTRMTQFKDKSQQYHQNINVGLFAYPILMAADILLYRTTHVPVGEDQIQHLELTREIARRFNEQYQCSYFTLPQAMLAPIKRLKGLDGNAKMSKSLNNYISLLDSPDEVHEKIKKSVTDPQRIYKTDKGNPDICNIFTLHKELTSPKIVNDINIGCRNASLGCVECKKIIVQQLNDLLAPIQEKYAAYQKQESLIKDILEAGRKKASQEAKKNYQEIEQIMGLGE